MKQSAESPSYVAYDRWEELHAEARENKMVVVTREEAARIAGVPVDQLKNNDTYLLFNGNKLSVSPERCVVYGYVNDGSDLEAVVNRLASGDENLLAN